MIKGLMWYSHPRRLKEDRIPKVMTKQEQVGRKWRGSQGRNGLTEERRYE